DIPMRTRRGQLRAEGFSFRKDAATYGFQETLKIQTTRVIPPELPSTGPLLSIRIDQIPSGGQVVHFGKSDHLVLQAEKLNHEVRIFPRLWVAEGACVETTAITGDTVSCPWHGRKYSPCLRIPEGGGIERQVYTDEFRQIIFE